MYRCVCACVCVFGCVRMRVCVYRTAYERKYAGVCQCVRASGFLCACVFVCLSACVLCVYVRVCLGYSTVCTQFVSAGNVTCREQMYPVPHAPPPNETFQKLNIQVYVCMFVYVPCKGVGVCASVLGADILASTQLETQAHTHANTYIQAYTRTHTHTHTHTHTNAQTAETGIREVPRAWRKIINIHTHMHTYTLSLSLTHTHINK